jgi:hypothetical protein
MADGELSVSFARIQITKIKKMEHNIMVQLGDDPLNNMVLADKELVDKIHSMIQTRIGNNIKKLPVSYIIVGPAKGKCKCCGRPFKEQNQ